MRPALVAAWLIGCVTVLAGCGGSGPPQGHADLRVHQLLRGSTRYIEGSISYVKLSASDGSSTEHRLDNRGRAEFGELAPGRYRLDKLAAAVQWELRHTRWRERSLLPKRQRASRSPSCRDHHSPPQPRMQDRVAAFLLANAPGIAQASFRNTGPGECYRRGLRDPGRVRRGQAQDRRLFGGHPGGSVVRPRLSSGRRSRARQEARTAPSARSLIAIRPGVDESSYGPRPRLTGTPIASAGPR
jgi:hypothetical protein